MVEYIRLLLLGEVRSLNSFRISRDIKGNLREFEGNSLKLEKYAQMESLWNA
jgi:hypothetical protein